MTELSIRISDEEVERAVSPFVRTWVDRDSAAWREEIRATGQRLRRARVRHALLRPLRKFKRSQRGIALNYTQQWATRPLDMQLTPDGAVVPCRWQDRAMYARAVSIKRVHQLYVMRVLEALRPTSVLEVGCGNGLNLFVLAGRFPEIRFTGLELTEGGTRAVEAVRRQPTLPDSVVAFSPEPPRDLAPFDRISIVRGSAAQLPFPGRSFDVVLTSLALEQMEEVRRDALSEISRVARAHTIMVEPFRDWNADGHERDYIVANDYFAARISDLHAYGLEPVLISDNMPSKLTNRPGLVVSNVR